MIVEEIFPNVCFVQTQLKLAIHVRLPSWTMDWDIGCPFGPATSDGPFHFICFLFGSFCNSLIFATTYSLLPSKLLYGMNACPCLFEYHIIPNVFAKQMPLSGCDRRTWFTPHYMCKNLCQRKPFLIWIPSEIPRIRLMQSRSCRVRTL